MYALADCNNFYASCERVFEPHLEGKPLVVLSNNDGCVIARSQESKELGFKVGDPIFKCKDVVRKHNVIVRSSNFATVWRYVASSDANDSFIFARR